MQPVRQLILLHLKSNIPALLLLVTSLVGIYSCQSNNKAAAAPIDNIHYIQIPLDSISYAEKSMLGAKCEQWYNHTLKKTSFTGGILIAKKGVPVFEQYQGNENPRASNKVDENTSMHIASVSKTFTAAAILKLMDEGKLSLSDPLSKYFSNFDYPGVTIQTLLSHRSGLPNYAYFTEDLKWDKTIPLTNRDILRLMTEHKNEIKDISTPNTHFSYCNTNFALLALVIEEVSKVPYDVYLQKNFFIPLQMNHTYVFHLLDTSKTTGSYKSDGVLIPFDYLDNIYGDKNIYSTVRDLLTWERALSLGLILKPETLKLAYMPYSNEKPGLRNYGLGWRMNLYPNGKRIIYHNGWWHGSNASFIRLLDEQATIIVIGNRFTRQVYKAVKLASLFGAYPVGGETPEDTANFNMENAGAGSK